jgi:hypothetical protein
MENLSILLAILFVVLFGGLILAMVVVGSAAMIWLWIQIFKWARRNENGRSISPHDANKPSNFQGK